MEPATEGVANKIVVARHKWKKTVGEFLLRLIGLGLAVTAIAIGIGYNYKSTYSPAPRETFSIKLTAPAVTKELLLVTADPEGSYRTEFKVLEQSIASYYGVEVSPVALDSVTRGSLDTVDGIIVFGNSDFQASDGIRDFFIAVAERNLPLFWIGHGLPEIAPVFGFTFSEDAEATPAPPRAYLRYKETEVPATGLPFIKNTAASSTANKEVLATLELYDTFTRPAIARFNGVTHFAFIPFSRVIPTLALAIVIDSLSTVAGNHAQDPRVAFRLEDVNGYTYGDSDSSFSRTADYLLNEGVFMHVAIIPTMVDAEGKHIADIDAATAVLELARTHPDKIAIVQHGFMHHRADPRNKGKMSGDAYEFFFDDDETLGEENAGNFARQRLEEGYAVLSRNGLRPLMFEAPHLEMSPSEQSVAADLFPLIQHPPLFFDNSAAESMLFLPWLIQQNGTVYAPSDIGYVDPFNPDSVTQILSTLDRLARVLPDPMVVIFYHPFMVDRQDSDNSLSRLIQGIRARGYRFVNLLDEVKYTTEPHL